MQQALEDLKGVAVIADDILVYGKGQDIAQAQQDHENNLKALLDRCREKSIKINKEKMKLRMEELTYMGHVIGKDGLKPDERKVTAIKNMETPSDVKQLKRFLGMTSYLAKFIPSLSSETEILR